MVRDFSDEITKISVLYHRNGISGEGFHAITFQNTTVDEKDYNGRLTAILPDTGEKKEHGRCYVIHTQNRELCYRGDNFEPYMREILDAFAIKRVEQMHAGNYSDEVYFSDMKAVRQITHPTYPKREYDIPKKSVSRYESIGV